MITTEQAVALLERTAATNNDRGIGSTFGLYSRSEAVGLARRCSSFNLRTQASQTVLVGVLEGFGEHLWYLNFIDAPADPWK